MGRLVPKEPLRIAKETMQNSTGVPTERGALDPIQRRYFWWKLLAVMPCLTLGVANALRGFLFVPVLGAVDRVLLNFFFSIVVWRFLPFFWLYTLIVAVVILRRKEMVWIAIAFLALGLTLPVCASGGWLWLRRII